MAHPGKFLGELIEHAGLTITAAAQRIGVSRDAISKLVNGNRIVSPEMAVRLEAATGIDAKTWMENQIAEAIKEARQKVDVSKIVRFDRKE